MTTAINNKTRNLKASASKARIVMGVENLKTSSVRAKKNQFVRDSKGNYTFSGVLTGDEIINKAKKILVGRNKKGSLMTSVEASRDYIQLKIAELGYEVFGCLFLDTQHRIITDKILFRGSIASCSVPVREIAKEALECNAGAVILFHNHPSGIGEPSRSDIDITEQIKKSLKIFDVRVLDHFICTTNGVVSFAEKGLI
jgi:DNA repair protein RadC